VFSKAFEGLRNEPEKTQVRLKSDKAFLQDVIRDRNS
jgi:hypothetical protein